MTRIVLEVPQDKDLDLLLPLLERLTISVSSRKRLKKSNHAPQKQTRPLS